jgi:protein-S-isoprenylcysteine O-methyltransferase Ste14
MEILTFSRWFALFRTAVFVFVFMGTVGVYLPVYFGLLRGETASDAKLLGFVPLLLGAGIALHCAFSFAWRGRGTPAPFDAPIHLVINGLYRYVRNPMYLGMALFLLGEWLIWGSNLRGALIYLGAFATATFLFVIAHEEPALAQKFGNEYLEYRRHVPRFVPRLTPWRPAQTKNAAGSV